MKRTEIVLFYTLCYKMLIMIRRDELQVFKIPCKNKYSKTITIFNEVGFNFGDASEKLSYRLNTIEWIIGYGSM